MSDMLQLVGHDAHSSSEERVNDRQAEAYRTSVLTYPATSFFGCGPAAALCLSVSAVNDLEC
jgi:hypothetical protein